MSDDCPTRDTMSLDEATIANMWEIAAMVELLEEKGLCTKQDLLTIVDELRRKNPHAQIPETAFPEPCAGPLKMWISSSAIQVQTPTELLQDLLPLKTIEDLSPED